MEKNKWRRVFCITKVDEYSFLYLEMGVRLSSTNSILFISKTANNSSNICYTCKLPLPKKASRNSANSKVITN
jgi:hypothetical protein